MSRFDCKWSTNKFIGVHTSHYRHRMLFYLLLISRPLFVSLDSSFMLNCAMISAGTAICSLRKSRGGSALIVHLSNNRASSGTVSSVKHKHSVKVFAVCAKNH